MSSTINHAPAARVRPEANWNSSKVVASRRPRSPNPSSPPSGAACPRCRSSASPDRSVRLNPRAAAASSWASASSRWPSGSRPVQSVIGHDRETCPAASAAAMSGWACRSPHPAGLGGGGAAGGLGLPGQPDPRRAVAVAGQPAAGHAERCQHLGVGCGVPGLGDGQRPQAVRLQARGPVRGVGGGEELQAGGQVGQCLHRIGGLHAGRGVLAGRCRRRGCHRHRRRAGWRLTGRRAGWRLTGRRAGWRLSRWAGCRLTGALPGVSLPGWLADELARGAARQPDPRTRRRTSLPPPRRQPPGGACALTPPCGRAEQHPRTGRHRRTGRSADESTGRRADGRAALADESVPAEGPAASGGTSRGTPGMDQPGSVVTPGSVMTPPLSARSTGTLIQLDHMFDNSSPH